MGLSHNVTVTVGGATIDGWTGYHVDCSMITMADAFELRRPFSPGAYRDLRRDAEVQIQIDGVPILTGFIDKRSRKTKAGTMTIAGRDRCGRLVDESAPAINYSGITILEAVERLVDPWFSNVTLSDAQNRVLRRGKGKRVASGAEPVVQIAIRVPRRGVVHPGMSRAQVIHEIASRANLIAWGSANGKDFFIGKPNQTQAPQYLFVHAAQGSSTLSTQTVNDMEIIEDDGDRYSLIMCAGIGGQSDTNYGANVIDNRGVMFDNPANRVDGTGRDFLHPKRLFMPERDFESYGDASRVARNEQLRRDFKRHVVIVEAPLHGQLLGTSEATLFAPNTVARLIDEEQDPKLDASYLIVSCAYSSNREQGETTNIHMVPVGTEIIL